MTTTDLQKLLDEATKGPWDVTKSAWDERHYVEGENTVCYMYALREDDHVILHCDNYESNARLIAMAPDLAARVIELEAENARLRASLERMLLEFDFLIEANLIRDDRNDVIFVEARAALKGGEI